MTTFFGRPRMLVASLGTVLTVLALVFVVQDLAHQPVLVTSLASSTFLLYYQPLNEINRFRPLVLGHMIAALVGFATSLIVSTPYLSVAVSISATVILLSFLRLVHPPAVSTSLVFAYSPREVTTLAVFGLTVVVVVALGLVYLLLEVGIRPSRLARHFGFEEALPRSREDDAR